MRFFLLFATLMMLSTSTAAEVRVGDAPTLEATAVDGTAINSSDYQGKVVLVDFWASWCAPCVAALPYYSTLAEQYGQENFVVVAVSVDELRSDVDRFLRNHELGIAIVWDETHELASEWSPPTMPTSFLIDRSGVVRFVFEGFEQRDRENIAQTIQTLLDEQSDQPAGTEEEVEQPPLGLGMSDSQ